MLTRSIFGVLIVSVLAAGGCSDSKPLATPPPAQAKSLEPVAPQDAVVDSSPPATDPLDAPITPPFGGNEDRPSQPRPSDPTETAETGSAKTDSVETGSSLEDVLGSVGRVLFGKSNGKRGEAASSDEQPAEDDGGRSILGSVGRALSKAAFEATRQAPPDEDK